MRRDKRTYKPKHARDERASAPLRSRIAERLLSFAIDVVAGVLAAVIGSFLCQLLGL